MSQINIICSWIHWISLEFKMHGTRLAVTLPCGHCYCLTKCKINKIYHFRMLIDSFYSVPGFQLNSKATHGAGHCYSNWICGWNLKFPLKCAYIFLLSIYFWLYRFRQRMCSVFAFFSPSSVLYLPLILTHSDSDSHF